jgi:hypothetical protein
LLRLPTYLLLRLPIAIPALSRSSFHHQQNFSSLYPLPAVPSAVLRRVSYSSSLECSDDADADSAGESPVQKPFFSPPKSNSNGVSVGVGGGGGGIMDSVASGRSVFSDINLDDLSSMWLPSRSSRDIVMLLFCSLTVEQV